MKKFICSVFVIACSLSLFVLVSDYTCENNALGAEIDFPEDLLSQEVVWEKCELFETQKRLRKAECADITVPLFWDSPERGSMTIHVKRLKALSKATKQMWYLEGGPGAASTFYLFDFMKLFSQADWKIDVYALDHRGTGYSERLGCPDQEAEDSEEGGRIAENEWDACIDHLEDTYNIDAFTVSNSAKDLGLAVELSKEKDKEVFVYGVSYGTYWAHRYAQIYPDQADGVILDSVFSPVPNNGLDLYDINANEALKDFFNVCKEDAFCNSKMGEDPWMKADATFDKFKNRHCPEVFESGLTPDLIQELIFTALDYWYLRITIPALFYRLDRCNAEDVNAFKHLLNNVLPQIWGYSTGAEVNSIPNPFSRVLLHHIGLSELMSDNPPEDMEEIDKTLLTSQHLSYRLLQLLERWPRYETDMYYREWASQDVPILMLNGTLDQRTHIDVASIAGEYLTGPHQYFIEVPNAVHGVCWKLDSPVKNIFAPDCGMQIMLDYIQDPLSKPDTSCLDNLMQIDFRGNSLMALLFFGTWDLWENGITTSLSEGQIILMKEEAEKIKQDLRQRWPRLR